MNNINNILILLAASIAVVIICLIVLIGVCMHLTKEITKRKKQEKHNEIMVKTIHKDIKNLRAVFIKFIADTSTALGLTEDD